MRQKMMFCLLLLVFVFGLSGVSPAGAVEPPWIIVPKLLLQNDGSDAAQRMVMPRNFTMDSDDNIYVFCYSDNGIRKYGPTGAFIVSFGKKGEGDKEFRHLMAIKVFGDTLTALDSVAALDFSRDGKFLKRRSFVDKALCNYPKLLPDGRFVGEQILEGELKKVLSFRDVSGREAARLAAYDLKEFFPGLVKGKDFFLSDAQTRSYLYDVDGADSIVWAASDEFKVYKYKDGKSTVFITGAGTPVAFPEDQRKKLEDRKARIAKSMPMMHQYVPNRYQLLQHVFVGDDGDVWVYVISAERTGLVRFSSKGKEKYFYKVEAEFDIPGSLIQVFKGKIYFMVPGRRAFKIYVSQSITEGDY